MNAPIDIILNALTGSLHWFYRSIVFDVPWSQNYFWGLTIISFVIWGLEMLFPWRKNQSFFRKDFWLDAFYMYFNFFIFTTIISGVYALISNAFSSVGIEMNSLSIIDIKALPTWIGLLIFFVLLDFVQWFTHVLLHKIPFFWQFHKVHHSVKEMGFAAHLRYHWMENILYKPFKTIAIMLLGGFEPTQAFMVHFVAITIGHLNHANLALDWGPLKYLLNNPVMHLYHHAKSLPKGRFGVNFGISLSVWDYLFNTSYVPKKNPHLTLGFDGDENFPKDFLNQNLSGFNK
ncbi:MAG: sterol desaturase family protein [Flavobacteriaceae bacterium]|jgi:sterol desaturase/sphingolipid hydroxylase (fatty acid hydroxylase superfamily)|nr:MAG: sterol desaturase [Polaribacter sp. BACL8 MAG-120531-bin13]KRP02863.1 MAG: sterol desaturase [Polaribacter sp. BACL8 MAG-120619-bin41]KRP14770.1 MAG: sterol desaturase [Polaribacter sp. BACL8 MAG-120419-bin8]MBT4839441.1 sterol desaturase family protein [Flavobacteriaceae bacterium]NQV62607.1 sterol desaturase family protein [Cryomorphaceae bacterium]|tara:strand:- start:2089 stop:2955 length:867 start_codon:yes stop_codon:yes gene_type:complete